MGKLWKQCQTFIFWGSKITADGDCSHEIKRCLLLGRKVMTNLDSIFKSRDITLPTKVRLVKAMISQWSCMDVRFGLQRKLSTKEWMLLLEKTIESPLDCKEIKPVNPKGNQSWIFIGGTDAEAEVPIYFGYLMWITDSLEKTLMLRKTEGMRRRGWQKMVAWHHWLKGPEFG